MPAGRGPNCATGLRPPGPENPADHAQYSYDQSEVPKMVLAGKKEALVETLAAAPPPDDALNSTALAPPSVVSEG